MALANLVCLHNGGMLVYIRFYSQDQNLRDLYSECSAIHEIEPSELRTTAKSGTFHGDSYQVLEFIEAPLESQIVPQQYLQD